jgi:hypothetical protein
VNGYLVDTNILSELTKPSPELRHSHLEETKRASRALKICR